MKKTKKIMRNKFWKVVGLALCWLGCFIFAVCANAPALEIIGEWDDNFSGSHRITANAWEQTFGEASNYSATYSIEAHDNNDNYLVYQNPADSSFNPNKFHKVVWTDINEGVFFYCTITGSQPQDTEQKAEKVANNADASDPEGGGCGSFTWTRMARRQTSRL